MKFKAIQNVQKLLLLCALFFSLVVIIKVIRYATQSLFHCLQMKCYCLYRDIAGTFEIVFQPPYMSTSRRHTTHWQMLKLMPVWTACIKSKVQTSLLEMKNLQILLRRYLPQLIHRKGNMKGNSQVTSRSLIHITEIVIPEAYKGQSDPKAHKLLNQLKDILYNNIFFNIRRPQLHIKIDSVRLSNRQLECPIRHPLLLQHRLSICQSSIKLRLQTLSAQWQGCPINLKIIPS